LGYFNLWWRRRDRTTGLWIVESYKTDWFYKKINNLARQKTENHGKIATQAQLIF
jgi:hypothetical protein